MLDTSKNIKRFVCLIMLSLMVFQLGGSTKCYALKAASGEMGETSLSANASTSANEVLITEKVPLRPELQKDNINLTEETSPVEETEPTGEDEVVEAPEEAVHIHDYSVSVMAPGCTEQGYTVHECICGDVFVDSHTEAVGHSWSGWTTVKTPTFTNEGIAKRCCNKCGAYEQKAIERNKAPESETIVLSEPAPPATYMTYPQEADFGKYYENAIKLYDALVNGLEEVHLFFMNDSYELEWQDYAKFKETFEEKVLMNRVGISALYILTGSFPEGSGITRVDISLKKVLEMQQLCYNANISAGLYTGMSEMEAVIKINDWMRANIVYEAGYCDPVSVLSAGKAQCAGYACLFYWMCKNAGIRCEYVVGCSSSNNIATSKCPNCHAWNRVKIGSVWYYIDVCWNDTKYNPNRYLLSETLWENRSIADCGAVC